MKKLLNWIADFLKENLLIRLYVIIVIMVVMILIYQSCTGTTERVTVQEHWMECKEEAEEVKDVQIPILNTCSQADVQSEKLVGAIKTEKKINYISDIPLDRKLQKYIFETCERYDISPYLVIAIIERESNFDVNAKGDKGESYGLMQIKRKYQKKRMKKLQVKNLQNPRSNVLVGIDYLAELFKKYEDVGYVLHHYNGGQAYANKLARQGKTSKYAAAVMQRAEELEKGSENIETAQTK